MNEYRAQQQQPRSNSSEPYAPLNQNQGEPVPPSDPNGLASLEREPAYLRHRRMRNPQHNPNDRPTQQPSRTVVDQNGEPRLGGESPWLYDKAD